MTTIPPLSEGTTAAIANLTDYSIEHEYGVPGAVDRVLGATTVALAGLQFDLRAQFVSINGTDAGLAGYAQATLRILVRDALEARRCQCHTLNGNRCPHDPGGPCRNHYGADVPPMNGALLCGTCHVAMYQAHPIEPGSPDAVHLAYRGDTAGICGRPTGVLTSDPGDYDCPECDAMYVGIMNADSEREYLALRAVEEPSAFPDAPPVRTHADGSQEYGPHMGGWISGAMAPPPEGAERG